MLFPCNFCQQMAFKDDRAALTELLTVKKKQYKFHGNNSMKEHNYALQNANTCPRLQRRMQNIMFCYLNFCCYFEANGQNHIHFQLIHVLKNSMAWYFLTITAPSSKLEFVYPLCCRVEEQMPFNAWTSQRLFKSNLQVNHRTHLKDCTPACLKFGKTSHPAVENLSHRTAQKWHWALF